LRPEIITAENVPELSQLRHPAYLEFIAALEKAGYYVTSKIVRCADYGVPQTRERLVVLASRLGSIELLVPTHDPSSFVTVRQVIGALPPNNRGGGEYRAICCTRHAVCHP
jgi:DNA (cytosine-5)-methyltransferase 1